MKYINCPLCGYDAQITSEDTGYVECTNCGVGAPEEFWVERPQKLPEHITRKLHNRKVQVRSLERAYAAMRVSYGRILKSNLNLRKQMRDVRKHAEAHDDVALRRAALSRYSVPICKHCGCSGVHYCSVSEGLTPSPTSPL